MQGLRLFFFSMACRFGTGHDATLVSPLARDGRPHQGADARPSWALCNAAKRKRRQTYPELFHTSVGPAIDLAQAKYVAAAVRLALSLGETA